LAAAKIEVDRKILADLAVADEAAFKAIFDKAIAALNQKKAA
jgi:ribosomal protein L20